MIRTEDFRPANEGIQVRLRLAVVALTMGTALVTAGCGSSTSGHSAETSTSATVSDTQLYDSCTLSDDAIAATGATPTTKDNNPFSVAQPGWKGCMWRGPGFGFAVLASTHTVDEIKNNASFQNFHAADVPGRSAFMYTQETYSKNCSVGFPTSKGTIEVLAQQVSGEQTVDTCAVALKAMQALSDYLPR